MEQHYSATYTDNSGSVYSTMTNDGQLLRMVLRGVTFISTMLDDWEPEGSYTSEQLVSFSFDHGRLTDYTLSFQIPIRLQVEGANASEHLHITLLLAGSADDRHSAREELELQLTVKGQLYKSQPNHGFFEDALLDLRQQLPPAIQLQTCLFCGLSDYFPAGNGLFGGLACFRDNKAAYRAVQSKGQLFAIWSTRTEFVQETYYCQEFEQRLPNTGYRG